MPLPFLFFSFFSSSSPISIHDRRKSSLQPRPPPLSPQLPDGDGLGILRGPDVDAQRDEVGGGEEGHADAVRRAWCGEGAHGLERHFLGLVWLVLLVWLVVVCVLDAMGRCLMRSQVSVELFCCWPAVQIVAGVLSSSVCRRI